MTSTVTYNGGLRTTCHHVRSGNEFITDAPVDNNGLGRAFSPTDTVATALGSCMLTTMGIKAKDMGVDMTGAHAKIVKHMASDPRRICKIEVKVQMPAAYSERDRKVLEHTARTCPVLQSIHPEIEKEITLDWVL